MLGEKAQLAACKEIIHIIEKLMNSVDVQPENTKDSSNPETMYSQHQLVVALQELGNTNALIVSQSEELFVFTLSWLQVRSSSGLARQQDRS